LYAPASISVVAIVRAILVVRLRNATSISGAVSGEHKPGATLRNATKT
jgi:hypothetical protein